MINKLVILLLMVTYLGCSYTPPVAPDNSKEMPDSIDIEQIMVVGDLYASGFMDGVLSSSAKQNSYTGILVEHIQNEVARTSQNLISADTEITTTQNFDLFKKGEFGKGAFQLDYKTETFIYPSQYSENTELGFTHQVTGEYIDATFAGLLSYEFSGVNALVLNDWNESIYDAQQTVTDIITDKNPGIVIVHIGQFDLTNAALSGISGRFNSNANEANSNDLISTQEFDQILSVQIQQLLEQTDAQIILFSLFDPLITPYFQTLDYAFEPEIYPVSYVRNLMSTYGILNEKIAEYHSENGISFFDARPQVDFDTENWPYTSKRFRAKMIEDEYLPLLQTNDGYEIPQIRMLVEDELILYNNVDLLDAETGFGGAQPLSDSKVITKIEADSLRLIKEEWNEVINRIAATNERVSVLDIENVLSQIQEQALGVDGVFYTTDFSQRSVFSADGYTFNNRGNAVIANEIISLLNSEFFTQFSQINPNSFRGINYRIK